MGRSLSRSGISRVLLWATLGGTLIFVARELTIYKSTLKCSRSPFESNIRENSQKSQAKDHGEATVAASLQLSSRYPSPRQSKSLHAPPPDRETTKSVFHDATCGTMSYAHEDPLTAATALTRRSLRAWHFSDLQVDFKDGEVDKVWVSDTCWKQLPRIERQKEPSALVSSLSPRRNMRNDTCGFLDDVWFIISDTQGRSFGNIFDDLSNLWYPLWLAKRAAFKTTAEAVAFRPKLTYYNGILNGMPQGFAAGPELLRKVSDGYTAPFPEVLGSLGDYTPWEKVMAQAKGGCVRFNRAFTTGSSWMWLDRPIPSYFNVPLAEFVHVTLSNMNQAKQRTSRCGYAALWASRKSARSRHVVNENEVLNTMRELLPKWDVRHVDLSKMTFEEQVARVRATDLFVFPHGGAGPHVLWLPHGAVVIELFPYGDADPMYRNLAVQSGKIYMSWQAEKYLLPLDKETLTPDMYHFTNASDFQVDVSALKPLLKSAAIVVRNMLGTNWLTSDGRAYYRKYCTLCTLGGEHSSSCDELPS